MLPEEVVQAARTLHAYLPPAEATTFATYAKRFNIPLKVAPKPKINKELNKELAPLLKEKKLLEKGFKATSKIDNVEIKYIIYWNDDPLPAVEVTWHKVTGIKSRLLLTAFDDAIYNLIYDGQMTAFLENTPEYKQVAKQIDTLINKFNALSDKFPDFDIDSVFDK